MKRKKKKEILLFCLILETGHLLVKLEAKELGDLVVAGTLLSFANEVILSPLFSLTSHLFSCLSSCLLFLFFFFLFVYLFLFFHQQIKQRYPNKRLAFLVQGMDTYIKQQSNKDAKDYRYVRVYMRVLRLPACVA